MALAGWVNLVSSSFGPSVTSVKLVPFERARLWPHVSPSDDDRFELGALTESKEKSRLGVGFFSPFEVI